MGLLDAGASPNNINIWNSSPLGGLCANSLPLDQMRECVSMLLGARCDVNARPSAPNMLAKTLQTIGAGLHWVGSENKLIEALAFVRTQPTPLSLATYWHNGT